LSSVGITAHIQLLTEEVGVFNLDQWLDMSVPQIDERNRVFVSSYNVGQFSELFWEEWLQIRRVRVIARVFDFKWFALRGAFDYEDTGLVPDTAKERASMQEANLRDVLARKNFILSKNELVVLENAEEHSVTTAETVLVRSICFYYFVDVSS